MEDHVTAEGHERRAGAPLPRRRTAPLIGAHVSTAGGLGSVPGRASGIGAEAVQVFSSNPRTWQTRWPDETQLEALTDGLGRLGLPLFFHTIYLINLASPDDDLRRRSAGAVAHALALGALAGAAGVVTHIGSHRDQGVASGTGRVMDSIHSALDTAKNALEDRGLAAPLPPLLLETGVGAGSIIGARLEELAAVLTPFTPAPGAGGIAPLQPNALPVGICLDSAHLFAAGYPVHHPDGLEEVVRQLENLELLSRVGLMHLNDSKEPFASNRDRHENPGDGYIGHDGLRGIVRHPALAHIPFVLEVPGADGHGPDALSVAVVKSMRTGGAAPGVPTPPRGPARAAERRAAPG